MLSLSSSQISQELRRSGYVIFYRPFLIIFVTLTYLLCPQILILKTCRLYNVFGSGANHAIYAQFMAQSSMANRGRKVGLLRGAGTRMALWFYAMMRLLRLKQALMATIHQQRFTDLTVNETVAMAVQDIENPDFWKCLYIILRAVFPALRLLRYCDKSKPAMDKIYYLSYRTTQALEQSESVLNDEALFGQITSDRHLGQAMDILGVEDND